MVEDVLAKLAHRPLVLAQVRAVCLARLVAGRDLVMRHLVCSFRFRAGHALVDGHVAGGDAAVAFQRAIVGRIVHLADFRRRVDKQSP